MTQIGRNDPCPCGSGKKYKKCCLVQEQDAAQNPAADVSAGLRQALEGKEFNSLEEAQAFAGNFMSQRNQRPVDDFHGLSPEMMYNVLNQPFSAPQLVTFPEKLDNLPEAPILSLFNLLVEAIGKEGLKPTAKGNLPRNFCRQAAQAYFGEEVYKESTRYGQINKEEDFFELHVARLVAELAGLIRKYKGRFILSRDCRHLLATEGTTVIYPRLLRAYVEQFNWGYWDGYDEVPFIQHSFLFTLYLLSRYGDDWQSSGIYEDLVLNAFPMVINEFDGSAYTTPEQQFRLCYTLRALQRFVTFLGLAVVERAEKTEVYVSNFRVKKLRLLDEVVRWKI